MRSIRASINSIQLERETNMCVSYNKLFKLLIDKGMKKQDLQREAGISSASVSKLAKNEYVRMEVLVKVCLALDVDFGDIMEICK